MTTSRRTLTLVAGGVLATAIAAVAASLSGGHVALALHALRDASRPWLAASFAGFVCAFVCTVAAWRAALVSAGARLCPRQAAARLGIGALVVAASVTHAMPFWPALLLVGGAGVVGVAAAASTRFRGHHRVSSLLDGMAALARDRRALAAVIAWTLGMQLSRLAGTVAVAGALGLPHPVLASLVILPALDLAGTVPITPGSIGIGSGAVAVALASRGIGMADALATGLAIQGVETLVSITCGSLGIAYLVRPSERVRRLVTRIAVVGASAALAATVGVVLLDVL